MTASRAAANPDTLEFETTVTDVSGTDITLAETYFYPGGGGQPADRGTIGNASVVAIRTEDDAIVHSLDEPPSVSVGETVSCQIDPAFRTYCRRAHTASHVLYGAGRRLFDELGYGGFDIDEEKVRVDLRTPTSIDDETLVDLERLTNRGVWDARPVSWESVDRDLALDRGDVAFNTATEEGVMADADTVRIVEIDGWDAAACGGTHVRNTIEVGPVTVLDRSNPGEGLTRVEFTVGPPAIRRRAAERRATLAAATALGVPVTDLDDAVADLQARHEAVREDRDRLRGRVLDAALDDLSSVDRDGETWRVGTVDGFDPNTVGDRLEDISGDVVAVAGRDGSTFVVVSSGGGSDAGEIIDQVTAEFGGGGGGGPAFAQGGGIEADPETVAGFLRSS
ncbi:MAG: alanyl-tRNA editing protein [Halobacteriaceae archaeon]